MYTLHSLTTNGSRQPKKPYHSEEVIFSYYEHLWEMNFPRHGARTQGGRNSLNTVFWDYFGGGWVVREESII